MINLDCFKAYDVRGRVPDQLNEDIAYRIGRSLAQFLSAKKIILGYDIRLSSPAIARAVARGITDAGSDVLDIGLVGTEEVYFASFNNDVDGGVIVTASHNPMDYNGMKLVRRGSRPISGDTGLLDIKSLVESGEFTEPSKKGVVTEFDSRPDFIRHLLRYIDIAKLAGLKVVVNAGNGGAGLVIDVLEERLPVEFVKIHHTPDGNFPNGIPNPLLVDNRQATIDAVIAHKADFGIAWDGDFDRCFLFGPDGQFIEGYYIVGLLAQAFLQKNSDSKVIHDPRLTWNTIDVVERLGGQAIQSKTGHAFIKERMRKEDAVYGGEMSAHHYFRDFAYCDSGMIPWLLVAELIGNTGESLSSMVAKMIKDFPVSGEINNRVDDADKKMALIEAHHADKAVSVDYIDGVSMCFDGWRFNLRKSNTEPLLRLNVETRGDHGLMEEKTKEILALIAG